MTGVNLRRTDGLWGRVQTESEATLKTVYFDYIGAAQDFVVPFDVTEIEFEIEGAAGHSDSAVVPTRVGGLGARVSGKLLVDPLETLRLMVGGSGTNGNGTGGGYNGGGHPGFGTTPTQYGGGGGGATDIRSGGTSLANRVATAAGGGGAGATTSGTAGTGFGGHGGTTNGADGVSGASGSLGGQGGQQAQGGIGGTGNTNGGAGTLGQGGQGATTASGSPIARTAGGGGGGHYGGGGGGATTANGSGAGGGSSYANVARTRDVIMTPGVKANHGRIKLTMVTAEDI